MDLSSSLCTSRKSSSTCTGQVRSGQGSVNSKITSGTHATLRYPKVTSLRNIFWKTSTSLSMLAKESTACRNIPVCSTARDRNPNPTQHGTEATYHLLPHFVRWKGSGHIKSLRLPYIHTYIYKPPSLSLSLSLSHSLTHSPYFFSMLR